LGARHDRRIEPEVFLEIAMPNVSLLLAGAGARAVAGGEKISLFGTPLAEELPRHLQDHTRTLQLGRGIT